MGCTETVAIIIVLTSAFWCLRWYSKLYHNQGSFFSGPAPLNWGEQVILVTGGASGIGEILANSLAARNVIVVVLDVNPIVTDNDNIVYYKCDVSKWEDVEEVSRNIVTEIGEPTILINNAGVVQGKLVIDLSAADVQQTFGVNTLSHFWILKAFLPAMLKKKSGHIVTMSSALGMTGVAQLADYCGSKSAVISLHESLRYELDKRYKCPDIHTTLVCPGHVNTPMFRTIVLPTFLCPSVQPVTVAKKIIAALDEQHSQIILLPFYTKIIPYISLLPSFLRDFFQWISGANVAMERFIKISGRRPDEGAILPIHDTRI